jgi:23S rRNA pseudouridine2605 synthase
MSERPRKPARGRAASDNARPPGQRPARPSNGLRRSPNSARSLREVVPEAPTRGRREPAKEPPVVPVTRRPTTPRAPAATAPTAAGTAAGPSQKLQKVLAQSGLGSRREMEEFIAAGKVLVNGEVATLGTRVSPEDLVKVGRRQIRFKLSAKLPRVILYHKPEGEIVSRDDPDGRPSVFDKLPVIRAGKWLAIGRLDFNTCGLLIFTTSGELANRLTHPRFEVEREYAVRIMGELDDAQARQLVNGLELDDGPARFDQLVAQGGEGRNHWYRVVVREGRNRLVRRMFEHLGLQVSRLMRVRFGIVNMPPRLKRGQHLELTDAQTRSVLDWLAGGKVADDEPAAPAPAPTRKAQTRSSSAPGGRASTGPGGRSSSAPGARAPSSPGTRTPSRPGATSRSPRGAAPSDRAAPRKPSGNKKR